MKTDKKLLFPSISQFPSTKLAALKPPQQDIHLEDITQTMPFAASFTQTKNTRPPYISTKTPTKPTSKTKNNSLENIQSNKTQNRTSETGLEALLKNSLTKLQATSTSASTQETPGSAQHESLEQENVKNVYDLFREIEKEAANKPEAVEEQTEAPEQAEAKRQQLELLEQQEEKAKRIAYQIKRRSERMQSKKIKLEAALQAQKELKNEEETSRSNILQEHLQEYEILEKEFNTLKTKQQAEEKRIQEENAKLTSDLVTPTQQDSTKVCNSEINQQTHSLERQVLNVLIQLKEQETVTSLRETLEKLISFVTNNISNYKDTDPIHTSLQEYLRSGENSKACLLLFFIQTCKDKDNKLLQEYINLQCSCGAKYTALHFAAHYPFYKQFKQYCISLLGNDYSLLTSLQDKNSANYKPDEFNDYMITRSLEQKDPPYTSNTKSILYK